MSARVPVPAMGGVRDVKRRMGTQRPIGVTVLVVVAATMVLMFAPVGQTLGLLDNICRMKEKIVEIKPHETVYLGSRDWAMYMELESLGCVNASKFLYTPRANRTIISRLYSYNLDWHEFTFISCGKYIVRIGSKVVEFKPEVNFSLHCLSKTTKLKVGRNVVLGRKCRGQKSNFKQSKAECKKLKQKSGTMYVENSDVVVLNKSNEPDGNTSHRRPLFGPYLFGDDHDSKELKVDNSDTISSEPEMDNSEGIFKQPEVDSSKAVFKDSEDPYVEAIRNWKTELNWQKDHKLLSPDTVTLPTYTDDFFLNDNPSSYNPGYTVHRKYKENAIPIFIGIVALTVSMCLRFCLCRGKSVMRRVTTVTVIRSRPVGSPEAPEDHQDPPPSYVDVVNQPTSPECPSGDGSAEPPPPAYADIVEEIQPPTYSEVEAQSLPASEMLPLAEQEAGEQNTRPPPDSEPNSDAKGLAATKSMLSKYRQQKQFAFKTLEED